MSKTWTVYLSGEIHSDWRDRIATATKVADLPVVLTAPVNDHKSSDDCGIRIVGAEADPFWHDHKGSKVNAIRTRTLIGDANVVVRGPGNRNPFVVAQP
ncbi:MAG: YtoQ family protein [Proteobacteria bacterium]|nr:YtoQ family protein [Pseudomonadota bacterium]